MTEANRQLHLEQHYELGSLCRLYLNPVIRNGLYYSPYPFSTLLETSHGL